MSLVTLEDYQVALDEPNGKQTSELILFDRMASLTRLLERTCCRAFPMMVSDVVASNESGDETERDLEFTIPHHGLRVGTSVKVETSTGVLSDLYTIDSRSVHKIQIRATISAAGADALLDSEEWVSVRKVRKVVKATKGGSSIFLDPRPVAEIISVTTDSAVETVAMDAADYALGDRDEDGLSFIGELMLKTASLPVKGRESHYSDGVTVEFVSGELYPPRALHEALLNLLVELPKRQARGDLQSESFEDYSYSRLSVSEVGRLFGESEYVIREFTLPPL